MKAIIQTISKIIEYIACRFHNGKQSINHTLKCLFIHFITFLFVKFYFNEDISHKWTINLLDFIYTFLSVVAIAYFLGIKESGYDVFITYLINKYRDNSISPKDYKLIAEYIKPYFDIVITYIAASISCTAIITTKLNNQYNKYFQSKHS